MLFLTLTWSYGRKNCRSWKPLTYSKRPWKTLFGTAIHWHKHYQQVAHNHTFVRATPKKWQKTGIFMTLTWPYGRKNRRSQKPLTYSERPLKTLFGTVFGRQKHYQQPPHNHTFVPATPKKWQKTGIFMTLTWPYGRKNRRSQKPLTYSERPLKTLFGTVFGRQNHYQQPPHNHTFVRATKKIGKKSGIFLPLTCPYGHKNRCSWKRLTYSERPWKTAL